MTRNNPDKMILLQNEGPRVSVFWKTVIAICGLVAFPFILLAISGNIYNVDYVLAFTNIYNHFQVQKILDLATAESNILLGIAALVTVASALLFNVSFSKEKKTKKFWHRLEITERHLWHLFVGYFTMLLLLNPMVAKHILEITSPPAIMNAETDIYALFLAATPLTAGIVNTTRILSRTRVHIGEINLGTFIFGIFVAEVILNAAFGTFPIMEVPRLFSDNWFLVNTAYEIIILELIFAFGFSLLDYSIVKQLMRRQL